MSGQINESVFHCLVCTQANYCCIYFHLLLQDLTISTSLKDKSRVGIIADYSRYYTVEQGQIL